MLAETDRTGPQAVEGFRLSPQQEQLWRLSGGREGLAPYCAWCAVAIDGELDRKALGATLGAVLERHELLRTAFPLLPGLATSLQVVAAARLPAAVAERDLSALARPAQEAAVEALIAALGEPFDLSAAPLMRWALVRLAADRHLLLLAMPALLADAAGLEVLAAEIAREYSAIGGGGKPASGPAQYIDLAEWQHELLESADTREGRDYWSRQPAAASAELPLAARDSAGPFAPRAVPVPLTPEAAMTSPVLLAAWLALLWRLSDRPEAVGIRVAFDGRKFEELREAPGLFGRHLPLQVRLGGEDRFLDLVERVAAAVRDHVEWQEYFPGGGGETACGFEHRPRPRRHAAGGTAFEIVRREARFGRFAAKLVAEGEGGGLAAWLEYDAALLDLAAAELLAERIATLLADAVAHPDRAVEDLEMVGPIECRKLLAEWNDTRVDLAGEKRVHRLVEAQAARTPARTAIDFEGERIAYADLDERAGRLAARLRRMGVGPQARVAVCLERSADLVVALLGVWKAGGAYVPLDPSYPVERLAFMIGDARPAVLVTGPGTPRDLAPLGLPVLDLAAEPEAPATEPAASFPDFGPDQLAYVIYTSGSTGRPKGVMVSHGAIANRLLWMQSAFPLGEEDAVLQKTPFGFDASIWELFVPLLAGARLVVARPGGHQDAAYLARTVAERGVTVLQVVPSLLGAFLDELDEGKAAGCLKLKRLFCGGEVLSSALRDRALASLPAELCNLYGPTECAIDATFWPCRRGDGRTAVPIGRPVANDRVHLLDERLRLVPAGTAGELYVAGAGLARGYLGRPDLTAERFIPDPFSAEPGGRLYRTGDLARRDAEGVIEFLGRADGQVKLRGVRIELGEVESVLASHPAVAAAVAAVREAGKGDRRLVAGFVPRGEAPAAEELRAFLAERLPEAMVPSAFVCLSALPRLPSGKVDRAALPAPGPQGAEGYVAPRTPTEEVLAARWAEVLGVERLGLYDNVFALGWHSLLATQFVSRLRRTFGVDLPLRSLFEQPTVASLAERIDAALRGGPGLAAPPVEPVPRDRPLALSFAQRRLWFLDQWQPGSPFYNIPMALRFFGPLDAGLLGRSLSEVVRRHESLRTRFAEVGDEPVQVIDPPRRLVLPLADLSDLPEAARDEELRRLVAEEALRPFDLAREPLLRAALVRLGTGEHVGLLTMHHIVSDGWSTGVLVRELGALYAAFVAGRRSPLPELPVQYADFAAWQRSWLAGEVLEAHVSYWRRHLEGAPPVLELPGDRPQPAVQSFRGATRARLLPAGTVAGVKDLARAEGVTLFMAMLAAGSVLLGWLASSDDVVVGSDVSGRDRAETEGLIGFFINQLALRVRLSGDPTFRELLARVRETTLGAYAHQELPFDKLVEALNPGRSRRYSPLFQVKINLHNVPPPALELSGLTLAPLSVPRETAQFDWILNLGETEQGFGAWVEYSSDLFDAATIDRMLGDYEALLCATVERPEARLSELAEVLAAADERQRAEVRTERRQAHYQQLKKAQRQAVGAPPEGGAPLAGGALS